MGENGELVRKLEGTKKAGINRVWWDLRHEPSKQAKLRTTPLYAPWVKFGPEGWRTIETWGVRGEGIKPLAAPGTYTVKLKVGDQELTQPLTVHKDPSSTGTVEDVKAQVAMSLEIRDNLSEVVEMINELEWIRKQLYDLNERLVDDGNYESLVQAGKDLDEKLIDFEKNLHQMKLTGGSQDVFRNPTMLYAQFGFLYSDVETSWGGVGSDWPPTAQALEVHEVLKERLRRFQSEYQVLMSEDVAAYQTLLAGQGVKAIVTSNP